MKFDNQALIHRVHHRDRGEIRNGISIVYTCRELHVPIHHLIPKFQMFRRRRRRRSLCQVSRRARDS
jgi:hypothetical protein